MNPSDWTALDAELARALDLEGDARAAYLAALDADVRAAVEDMLRVALEDDPLLDDPEAVAVSLMDEPDAAGVGEGERVGPYRIEELVGEGGMGRVYRARRADGAFDKTVAVKVVRRSLALAGADVLARLRRERALLATLDHPGIARLVDGGETDDGVPYLVTEFVEGAPITAWADAHGLEVGDRVRLLVAVARAVDHAHRRFVVHRDLKPSNVLVTEADGAPRPVVLDFGIAKLVDAAEDEGTGAFPLTRTGMRLLTPAYAAPELYDPTSTVTTAADVYGLGALLYELLTGRRPHDDDASGTAPTTEPTRPSRVVTEPADTRPADPASRSRALRGDLDTICLKALHPDPARRYASASDLADDLERHLEGRPVEARPDSRAYVVGRFVRRNRGIVAAVGVAVLALVVGLGAALVALANEREAVARAELSAEQATTAAQVLLGVFEGANPELLDGRELTARQVLDRALEQVRALESAPLRGYLFTMLGDTYSNLGERALADSLLTAGIGLLDPATTPPLELGQAYYALARFRGADGDFDTMRRHLEQAHAAGSRAVLEADGPLDPADDRNLLLFGVMRDAAWLSRETGDLDGSIEWAERGIEFALGGGAIEKNWGHSYSELGLSLHAAGRTEEAVEALREAVHLTGNAAEVDSSALFDYRNTLAIMMAETGRTKEGIRILHDGVEGLRRLMGTESIRVGQAMSELGNVYLQDGQYRNAAVYLDSTRIVFGTVGLGEVAWTGRRVAELAWARTRLGEPDAAEEAAREALRIAEVADDDDLRAQGRAQLGLALAAQRKPQQARTELRAALPSLDADDWQTQAVRDDVRTALSQIE